MNVIVSMELDIRAYSAEDKTGVIDLILRIQQQEFQIPIDIESQPDLSRIEDFYQRGNGNFWVAVANGRIVGTIALLDIGNSNGAVRKMFVDRDYRGKEMGIGKSLLDKLLYWSIERRMATLFLGTTEKFLAAQRFYEKHGFIEIAQNELPVEFPVMTVDVKFYKYIFLSENERYAKSS